jgi:hypothetical protein
MFFKFHFKTADHHLVMSAYVMKKGEPEARKAFGIFCILDALTLMTNL